MESSFTKFKKINLKNYSFSKAIEEFNEIGFSKVEKAIIAKEVRS